MLTNPALERFGIARRPPAPPAGRPYQDTSLGGRAGVRAGADSTRARSALAYCFNSEPSPQMSPSARDLL